MLVLRVVVAVVVFSENGVVSPFVVVEGFWVVVVAVVVFSETGVVSFSVVVGVGFRVVLVVFSVVD